MKSGSTARVLTLLATSLCMGCLDYSPYDGGTCANGKFEDDEEGVSESDEFLSPLDRNFTTDPIQSRGIPVEASSFKGCSVLVGSRLRIEDYEFYNLVDLTEVYGSLTLNVASFEMSVDEDILVGLKNLREVKPLADRPASTSLRTLPTTEEGGDSQLSQLTLNFAVAPPENIIADLPSLKSVDRLTITGGDGLTSIAGFNALESVKEILITGPKLSSISGFQSLTTVESITVISQSNELGCLSVSLQNRWPGAKVSALREPGDTQPVRCSFLIKANEDWSKLASAEGVADLTISGVTAAPTEVLSLKTITGNLTIQDTELSDLSFLQNVESIGGQVSITNNPRLSMIELPRLMVTGSTAPGIPDGTGQEDGTLLVDSNSTLQGVSLPALTTVIGSLIVTNCMSLGTFTAERLGFYKGLELVNTSVTEIDFSSSSDQTDGNAVRIIQNPQLRRVWLMGMGSASLVEVSGNDRLVELGLALSEIQSANNSEGYFRLEKNKELTRIVSNLTSVQRDFTIKENSKLQNLQGFSLIRMVGDVLIQGNTSLDSVVNLFNLSSISGSIENNPALSCEIIQALLNIVPTLGMLEVRNNLNGCSL